MSSKVRLLYLVTSLSVLFCAFAEYTYGSTQGNAAALEKFVPSGWRIEIIARGDLNGDKLEDLALVLIDKDMREMVKPESEQGRRMLIVLVASNDDVYVQIGLNRNLLRCSQCFGIMGGGPEVSIKNGVLIVDQLAGSRFTDQGVWRFRFEANDRKLRLIGLDVRHTDRSIGESKIKSTNYLTGKQIVESYRFDEQHKDILIDSSVTQVAVKKTFLEETTSKSMEE